MSDEIDNTYEGDKLTRKSTAAYYSTKSTAALLAGLAMPTLPVKETIRIGDFACGAGILLVEAVRQAHINGTKTVHVYGVDIDPIALKKCANNIKAVQAECPDMDIIPHVYRAPIGDTPNGIRLGALDMIRKDFDFRQFELVYGTHE